MVSLDLPARLLPSADNGVIFGAEIDVLLHLDYQKISSASPRDSFAFEIKSPFVDPLQMIEFVDNLYPMVTSYQGAQMLIQMFACSPAEVGH
jgi:hypothetical protein